MRVRDLGLVATFLGARLRVGADTKSLTRLPDQDLVRATLSEFLLEVVKSEPVAGTPDYHGSSKLRGK